MAVYRLLESLTALPVRDASLVTSLVGDDPVSQHALYLGVPRHPNWYIVVSVDGDVNAGDVLTRKAAKEQVLFRIWIVQTALSAANLLSSEVVTSICVGPRDLGGVGERWFSSIDLNTFARLADVTGYLMCLIGRKHAASSRLVMQIQDCGLKYRNASNTLGSGRSINAVCVGNAWFDLSREFWRVSPDSNDDVEPEFEEMVEIFSKQGQTRFADRVLSGLDDDTVFIPSMPFGNLYLLVDGGDDEVRIVGKIRLNCAMLPGIEVDSTNRRYEVDCKTGIISFSYEKVSGCVGSLLYQLVPVLFTAQLANQCMDVFV
jgi:hypothetical protein